MAVTNSLQKKQNSGVVTYKSNGEEVNLSPNFIKQYLVSGGGTVTDEEVMMFLSLCRFQHLNPFLREAYLIKYGDRNPATMVVGKDVFIKRARRNQDFAGFQAGIIVTDNETGQIIEREGTFYQREFETLVGGWAKVYIKGYDQPFYESVSIDEYEGKTKEGKPNSQWATKGATMIRKVALAHALREAFPDETAGMYAQEEIAEAQDIILPETPVQIPEVSNVEPIPNEPQNSAQTATPEAALFG